MQDKRDAKPRKIEKIPVNTTANNPLSERNANENYATSDSSAENLVPGKLFQVVAIKWWQR